MSFFRFQATWSGPGGPGYSHLDIREAAPLAFDDGSRDAVGTAFKTYYGALAGYLPNEWTIAVSSEVLQLSDAGVLEEVHNITTGGAAATGTYSGSWAGAVGVCTRFVTADVVNGRRVRGKTFFVPAGTTVAFDQDGTLNSTCTGDFNTARINLHNAVASNEGIPVVFSPTHLDKYDITGFNIADRSAVLRSRRP